MTLAQPRERKGWKKRPEILNIFTSERCIKFMLFRNKQEKKQCKDLDR